MQWLSQTCQAIHQNSLAAAQQRQTQLTKPTGSLGVLETAAIRLAGLQGREQPQLDKVHISIFAADHGIAEAGVSAFPQAVTTQMVANFLQGGAAISVLAQQLNAHLEVIDTGIKTPLEHPKLISQRIAAGTANSLHGSAMSSAQLEQALQAGKDAAQRAVEQNAELFIGGEMGIGNTTAATAIYCALLQCDANNMTGPGTGLDQAGITHKTQIIQAILQYHAGHMHGPLEILRRVGGFEIAALTGAYIHAAQCGIPILVDGFISSAAALLGCHINPTLADWLFLAHTSAEPGHQLAVHQLQQLPLLDLGLRLGEGSGAALAVPLLRSACALHNQMATFAEAAVANKL